MPRSQATEFSDTSTDAGCSNTIRRAALSLLRGGIYVCPAHRDRSMSRKCGHASDCYCASWGCETTGDTYWSPSSTWDYIIVKRKFPVKRVYGPGEQLTNNLCPSAPPTHGWCNPLIITFTTAGKKINWENVESGCGSSPKMALGTP